jgi:WD40 repeat protein
MSTTPISTQNNNPFFLLNDDALCCILLKLPRAQDIFSVWITDKRFAAFVSHSVPFWQNILAAHFPFYTSISNNPKGEYQSLNVREENMSKLRPVITGHGDLKLSEFIIQNNKLVVRHDLHDHCIDVTDLQNHEKHAHEIPRGMSGVYIFSAQGNHLCYAAFLGPKQTEIFVWDLNDKERQPKHILKGHQSTIKSLIIQKNEVVSASAGGIKVWDLESGEELKVCEEINISAHAVQGDEHFIASDETIKVYDKNSGKELYTLKSELPIYKLIIQGTNLVSLEQMHVDVQDEQQEIDTDEESDFKHICKVWDLQSKEVRLTLNVTLKDDLEPSVTLIDNVLFLADTFNRRIMAWNIKTGKQLPPLLFEDLSTPRGIGIQSHEGRLYLGSKGRLTVFDFNFPPPSRQVLEENLAHLEKMAASEDLSMNNLADKSRPLSTQSPSSKENLVHKQTTVIVELLLGCIRSGDQNRISELLMKLTSLGTNKMLYKHLWRVCEEPKLPEQMGRSRLEKWGYCTFLDGKIEGYKATDDQKEQALLRYKNQLLGGKYSQLLRKY